MVLTHRKRSQPQPYPESWVVATETTINGRHVVPGTVLSIKGERGKFRFSKRVLNTANNAEWITVIGGPAGADSWRDFRPERVKTVHRR